MFDLQTHQPQFIHPRRPRLITMKCQPMNLDALVHFPLVFPSCGFCRGVTVAIIRGTIVYSLFKFPGTLRTSPPLLGKSVFACLVIPFAIPLNFFLSSQVTAFFVGKHGLAQWIYDVVGMCLSLPMSLIFYISWRHVVVLSPREILRQHSSTSLSPCACLKNEEVM